MSIVTTLSVAVAVLIGLAWVFQRSLIYFPSATVPEPEVVGLGQVERVTFSTADGQTLAGWFIASPRPQAFTVLVFNGNAGNRAYRAPLAAALQAEGMHVLLFDYRGYGGSDGSPSEQGLRTDARAARAYLAMRPEVDLGRLVYFGESLGTAVAADLAAEQPPAGLILRSPFTSLVAVGRLHYPFLPVGWLLNDRFAAVDVISQVQCPVLIVAGDDDRIIPVEQSRQLYRAVTAPKELVIVPRAGHNDHALLAGPDLIGAVVRFVSTLP